MKYRTRHIARHKSISRFTPIHGEIEAANETEAINKTRLQLEESDMETAGGYAECQCSCHYGEWDGYGVCKQPCDQCECEEE